MDRLHSFIVSLANQFQREGTDLIRKNIQSADFVVSGDLMNSIETRIKADAAKMVYEISLITTEYASIVDGRRKNVRQAAADVLIEYVKRRGIDRFEFVPNYRDSIPDLDVAARRIAYGLLNGPRSRGRYRSQYKPNVIIGPYRKHFRKFSDQIVGAIATQTADKIFNELVDKKKK